jgi:hypothetical protein
MTAVIHTPCDFDWTDETGHHNCGLTMDHRGDHALTTVTSPGGRNE